MPAESFHLGDFIEEEMAERKWSLDELAFRMCGITQREWQITRLALEMFLVVRDKNVLLGEMAEQFSRAFSVSLQFFINMHEAWRKAQPNESGDAPSGTGGGG